MRKPRIHTMSHPDFIGPRMTERQRQTIWMRVWRSENPESQKAVGKRHYQKHCERKKEERREYYQKNKAKCLAVCKRWHKEQLATNPEYKLVSSLRTRLSSALKGWKKSAKTMKLVGCQKAELRAHIEAQFQPGMTWENHGKHGWHIDHIIPVSAFDMTDPDQQALCFHYTNLQPLWASDNHKKSGKLTPQAIALICKKTESVETDGPFIAA